ncbi:MAG: type IV secretory system conjugative DNA transfer family protein [Patescibacteria group bacterium UBA2163]
MKQPGGEGNISPEHQLNKLRESERSGGDSGRGRRTRSGATDVAITPETEQLTTPQYDTPTQHEASEIRLNLAPDTNDKDMEHLLSILQDSGWKAVRKELDRINNPHIEDDFHRLLVQYKKDGHEIPGLNKNDPLNEALNFMLFEIAIPVSGSGAGEKTLKDIFVQMEQLYLAIVPYFSVPDPVFFKGPRKRTALFPEHFTLELAVRQGSEDATFYIAIDRSKREFFEKQVFSIFPKAIINEVQDDYNIFNQFGETVASKGRYARGQATPINTGAKFDYDPMNVTLAAFSKIAKEGEGAAIQFSVSPAGDYLKDQVRECYFEAQKGAGLIKAQQKWFLFGKHPWSRRIWPLLWKWFSGFFKSGEEEKKDKAPDSIVTTAMAEKMKSPVMGANLRLVASARTKSRAESILSELELSFGQFENSEGNRFRFTRVDNKKELRTFLRQFIFRQFEPGFKEDPMILWLLPWFGRDYMLFDKHTLYLNLAELAAAYHISIGGGSSSRELKSSGSAKAPAPMNLSDEGIVLGENTFGGRTQQIHFDPDDRLRHFYAIGQTGTGKTTLLKQMITQDIENGEGVCFIDPHGVDVQDILSRIPKERYDDVIYFDPAHTERPMGMNMLEFDPRFPEQKTFVVDEMFKIFQKLYGKSNPEAFGPVFETYFRNATLLVLEDPETGSTLMDISRVLSDDDFRHYKLSRSNNPVVNHFWEEVAEQVRGEGDLRNVVPYITSKFDIFIANEIMRPIIGQQRSAFTMSDIMENKKILLVNLSKGRLGDVNADLIGLVIVGKILMAALARSETLNTKYHAPFYLYMDEFQNITTNSIATILSEARKYGLSLTIAHQYIKQLSPTISEAVFGNVGSMAAFRIGSEDAQFLERQYAPEFTAKDMVNIDNYNAYVRMLAKGKPVDPFSLETLPFISGEATQVEALKHMSYQRYGRQRAAVEEEIREKYQGMRGIK